MKLSKPLSIACGVLAVFGVAGAGFLMAARVVRGEAVSAQPLLQTGITYGFPVVTHSGLKRVDPKDIFVLPPAPPVPQIAVPRKKENAMAAPELSSVSALLIDAKSGAVLYEKEPSSPHALASLTKLITGVAAVRVQPFWAATSTVAHTSSVPGRHFFEPGDTVTLRDLLFASLSGSSNVAAIQLAGELVPEGASFVAKMRLLTEDLGLESVRVADPAGLSPDNIGSVRDVITLFRIALEKPILREALQTGVYESKTEQGFVRTISSTNLLLLGDIPVNGGRVVGGKTGYLPEAGYNFVMAVEDAEQHTLYVAVLGARDHFARFTEAKKLAEWAFENYSW